MKIGPWNGALPHGHTLQSCGTLPAASNKAPLLAGAASRSFTSTAVNVVTKNTRQRVRVERNPSKKGYLRLHTNLGDLNLELHCDIAPRTCENFILLAESGYYTGTKFHRLIKNFMIQVVLATITRLKSCKAQGYQPAAVCYSPTLDRRSALPPPA